MSHRIKNIEKYEIIKEQVVKLSYSGGATIVSSNVEYSKQDIIAYLAELIEDILDINIADYNETFMNLGLASVDIPLFMAKLARQFGVEIEVASIFEHPNINMYTDYL